MNSQETEGTTKQYDSGFGSSHCSVADAIEMAAADRAYQSGLGVGEWEAFLTFGETKRLIRLADQFNVGTWSKKSEILARMKNEVARIEAKTD